MMRGLKSVAFAAFVAGSALAVGCGGTEMPEDSASAELGTKESAVYSCPASQYPCNTNNPSICCDPHGGTNYACTYPIIPCTSSTDCPTDQKCAQTTGGNWCVPKEWVCAP